GELKYNRINTYAVGEGSIYKNDALTQRREVNTINCLNKNISNLQKRTKTQVQIYNTLRRA
ncbi:hypothetical protein AK88_05200, partial [Plasmodium fragile]